jgi:uncharacterized membrane-anchored protein
VVISVFGTLITDNLTDRYKVPLTTSTPVFAVLLAIVFAVWYASERTLSDHSAASISVTTGPGPLELTTTRPPSP